MRWGDKISDPHFARTNPRIAEKIKPSTLATLYLFQGRTPFKCSIEMTF